jgi:hypothetical protein
LLLWKSIKKIGRYKEDEKQYLLALEADPKNIDVHYFYGTLLEKMGCKQEAEKLFWTFKFPHFNETINKSIKKAFFIAYKKFAYY